ncbi:hypothetical protein FOVSG1_002795 [Fusarium oxysporum f. sp. vasinfectum]
MSPRRGQPLEIVVKAPKQSRSLPLIQVEQRSLLSRTRLSARWIGFNPVLAKGLSACLAPEGLFQRCFFALSSLPSQRSFGSVGPDFRGSAVSDSGIARYDDGAAGTR